MVPQAVKGQGLFRIRQSCAESKGAQQYYGYNAGLLRFKYALWQKGI